MRFLILPVVALLTTGAAHAVGDPGDRKEPSDGDGDEGQSPPY